MKKVIWRRLAGCGLVLIGFLILGYNFLVAREADELYGVVAGVFLIGGFGLLIDNSITPS